MNILMVTCDALRYDHVTEKYMPGLIQLSKNGAFFSFCLACEGVTLDSVPYLLSSSKEYDEKENLGTILQSYDYKTMMIHSNPLLSRFNSGFDSEIDLYKETSDRNAPDTNKVIREFLKNIGLWRKTERIRQLMQKPSSSGSLERNIDEIPYVRVDDTLAVTQDLIVSLSDSWFLWVHLMDPHVPYLPVNYDSFTTYPRMKELNDKVLSAKTKGFEIKEDERREIKHLYSEEVRYLDKHLTDFLKRQDKDTLVVITSDHGELFGEYGLYRHSPGRRHHGLTPQLLHVPLIFLGAGIKSQINNDYVCHLDVAPTILDVAGITKQLGYGNSLKNMLIGRAK